MTLPTSGTLSLSSIQGEFGGSNPISMSEYYRSGPYVPNYPANAPIPTSGTISINQFYGATNTAPSNTTFAFTAGQYTSGGKQPTTSTGVNTWNSPFTFGTFSDNTMAIGGPVYTVVECYDSSNAIIGSAQWRVIGTGAAPSMAAPLYGGPTTVAFTSATTSGTYSVASLLGGSFGFTNGGGYTMYL